MAELINRLKIFISWHNDAINNSKLVAREFKLFIKALFELDVDVFYSGDMESGKWRVNLDNGFVDCSYAVFILQGDAVNANWINAEYGAFAMKSLLNGDDACSKLIAFRFPDDKKTVSDSKAPIKDLQVYELSPNPEQGVLSYFGRMLYELKNDVVAKKLSDDDYIKLLKEEKGGVFSRCWDIFIRNIGLLKLYGKDYKREKYVLNNVISPANISTPTSIDDIDFNKIAFCYTKPDNKDFFGRELFVNKLHDCFEEGKNCLNVVATGGMGKTSVAHIYIKKFRNEYDKVHFVTSNHDIRDDFNEDLRKCITNIVPSYGALLKPRQEGDKNDFLGQVDHILAKATKKCLLVVDVNVDEEGLSALKLNEAKNKWHILYLSRKKIKGTLNKGFELPNFEGDLDGAKGLFNSIYANDWDDDKLKRLFKLVYYHPLLIEHLAAYGVKCDKSYEELCDVVSENSIKNASVNKRYSEYSTCFIDKEGTKDVCVYLSQLFVFDQYSEDEKYVLQHFILWPYDYISKKAIEELLKSDKVSDFDGALVDLTDKVVFTKSEKGYRMHGLLGDTLKGKGLLFDYTNYVHNVKMLIKSGEAIFDDTYKCIDSTPLSVFGIGSDKDYSVYEDWVFLRGLAKLKIDDTELSELSYKVKLLNELYNLSGKEISEKLFGEYKTVLSNELYYNWVEQQPDYMYSVPSDGIIRFAGVDGVVRSFQMIYVEGGSFQMGAQSDDEKAPNYDSEALLAESPVREVSLDSYYIGESQVTQGLWDAVMGKDKNTSQFKKGDDYPVDSVSWYDCFDFIMNLNKLTKLIFCLPSDKQWEYAARGGKYKKPYKYSGSNNLDEVAWYGYEELYKNPTITTMTTMPVKRKFCNALKIYDMSGNVWEWCQDICSPLDFIFIHNTKYGRVLRGGSWADKGAACRVSARLSFSPDARCKWNGFRLTIVQNKQCSRLK